MFVCLIVFVELFDGCFNCFVVLICCFFCVVFLFLVFICAFVLRVCVFSVDFFCWFVVCFVPS